MFSVATAKRQKHLGAKAWSLWLLGGHGAKDENATRQLRRYTEEQDILLGETNVQFYTPVGDTLTGVESSPIPGNKIYTNTSLTPSIAYALVCDKRVNRKNIFRLMASELQLLDRLSGIKYEDPGDRFPMNPPDEKWFWGRFQGEQIRKRDDLKLELHSRVSAKDPLHFPLCLTCITIYDEDGDIPENIHPTIREFMLNSNCKKLEDHDFPNKKELLRELNKQNSVVRKVIEPFAEVATTGVNKNFADLNLFSSKNSGVIIIAIREIMEDARTRIKTNTHDDHDIWLVTNHDQVILFYQELVLTKKSKLSRLKAICKFVSPPNTDLKIVDNTCSGNFTTQPAWATVSTISGGDTLGSFPVTPPGDDVSSSSSSSDDDDVDDEATRWWDPQILFNNLWSIWPGWTQIRTAASTGLSYIGTAASTGLSSIGTAASTGTVAATKPSPEYLSSNKKLNKSRGGGSKSPKRTCKRTCKRTKRYISHKNNHIKKHKKRYYTMRKKRRNI